MSTTPAIRSDRRSLHGVLILLFAGSLFACDSESDKDNGPAQGDPSNGVAAAVEKTVDDAIAKADADHLFDPADKALRKRACELLTAEMVSGLFDVPATELKQFKMMGCMYTWEKDDQVLDAKVMLIRVHKTQQSASRWLQNATATKTKAQLDAEMDGVKKKVQEREELNTDLKKKAAGSLTDIAKMGMPDEGVSYDDVPRLGDEARVSNTDGVIWVRLANMTFQISAYKGTAQPQLKFDPKNLKGIAKAAMDAQKTWTKATLEQRKKDAMTLAPLVVTAVREIR